MGLSAPNETVICGIAASGKPELTKLELYNYDKDPEETVNLATHPQHTRTIKGLCDLMQKRWRAARPVASAR